MVILRQQMRSKPERTDDVWAALAAIIPGARATPGVISLDIARDLLDPDSFVATAVYEDGAALERQESTTEVHAAMKSLKESGQVLGALALTRLSDFAPPNLLTQVARLQVMERFFNLVVTNVPGPQFPLYFLGRQMLACYPVVPLAAGQTVGIALLSYHGSVGVEQCAGQRRRSDARTHSLYT